MIDIAALLILGAVLALPLLSFLFLRIGYSQNRQGTYILDDEV